MWMYCMLWCVSHIHVWSSADMLRVLDLLYFNPVASLAWVTVICVLGAYLEVWCTIKLADV